VSYASAVVVLTDAPRQHVENGREFVTVSAQVPSDQRPIPVLVRAYADSAAAKALTEKAAGARLLISGDVQLTKEPEQPLITATVICPAYDDQYLCEVSLVGRVGGEPRDADKSTKRSIAINRYLPNPDGGDPIEETDWFGCRAFGKTKDRFSKVDIGSLVQVSGSFSQMANAKGEPYVEVKVRGLRTHKGGKGGGNPAVGTAAVGYDQASFEGNDDISSNW
jgi:hypothetical protein